MNQRNGESYVSIVRVRLDGQVPEFAISASAPSLTALEFIVEGAGAMFSKFNGITPDGRRFDRSRNLYGAYILTLHSTAPEHFNVQYECSGVTCVGP